MIGEKLVNRYEILEKVGDGGMALVYRAKDTLLNRIVAVKVLRDQFATDMEFVERFRREAQAAASLSHPNVVNIYDVGQTETLLYQMEYVRAKTSVVIRRGCQDFVVRLHADCWLWPPICIHCPRTLSRQHPHH